MRAGLWTMALVIAAVPASRAQEAKTAEAKTAEAKTQEAKTGEAQVPKQATSRLAADLKARADKFGRFVGVVSTRGLPASEVQTLKKLLAIGPIVDAIFWRQNSHEGPALQALRKKPGFLGRLIGIHYGRWDRTEADQAFYGPPGKKPIGSGFYPADASKPEIEAFLKLHPESRQEIESPFSVIKRSPERWLQAVPYHEEYQAEVTRLSQVLREAAALTANASLRRYLELRAQAVLNDDYLESDKAWLDIQDSAVDVVVAPYETYDDGLFGFKAAYEGIVLVRDREATEQLSAFGKHALGLEAYLPVPDNYKKDKVGAHSPIGVYLVAQSCGDANAGIKSIAASLPNDERVREEKGAKTLMFKNVMEAKFETILKPIAARLIAKEQLAQVKFPLFFEHSLLHELSHPLGLNYILRDGKPSDVPVRTALGDRYSTIEEAKADVLGLFIVNYFIEQGVLRPEVEADAYVTQVASIFRTVRFGAGEAHGKANMIQFNFLREKGGIVYDAKLGRYKVEPALLKAGIRELATLLLRIEGDGDYEGAGKLIAEKGDLPDDLARALAGLKEIPTDVEINVTVR